MKVNHIISDETKARMDCFMPLLTWKDSRAFLTISFIQFKFQDLTQVGIDGCKMVKAIAQICTNYIRNSEI